MRNIQDFRNTKEEMLIHDFNQRSNQDVDGGCDESVFVYMEHYYITIDKSAKMGYDAIATYYLNIENRCYKETNLAKLEAILYKWYLDNVDNEDWLYNVGIFNKKTTPLYYKVFMDMGFEVEDTTYHNDCSDSFTLSLCGKDLFDIYLPTSANYEPNQEKYNAFHVLKLDDKGERIEENLDNQLSLKELEDFIEESLHQSARDIIDECNKEIDGGKKVSLCDYMSMYGEDVKKVDESLYNRLKRTLYYFDGFKRLEDWYIHGSEPTQMFDDGVDEILPPKVLEDEFFDVKIDRVYDTFSDGFQQTIDDCCEAYDLEVNDDIAKEVVFNHVMTKVVNRYSNLITKNNNKC